jgi:hypothetical protein
MIIKLIYSKYCAIASRREQDRKQSRKQKTENRKQKTESRKQKAESRTRIRIRIRTESSDTEKMQIGLSLCRKNN